ncbi:MAG: hypothetical protein C4519_08995 [Desulfobacteraceae bacterium]|nr:MAG: hypothetical protein C4519_08995 [Desulfobacteraceae bacterium]
MLTTRFLLDNSTKSVRLQQEKSARVRTARLLLHGVRRCRLPDKGRQGLDFVSAHQEFLNKKK